MPRPYNSLSLSLSLSLSDTQARGARQDKSFFFSKKESLRYINIYLRQYVGGAFPCPIINQHTII